MKLHHLLVGLACAACVVTASAQQQPIVIKFSHVATPDAPKGKSADFFKQRAEALTNGKVKVEVYHNSMLYKDKEELEALQLGAVQMLAPSLAKFGPLGVREFELFDLPFLFADYQQLHKITDGPIGKRLLDMLKPKGIKGLAYWDMGFKSFSANKPLKTLADYKGLKLRIQSSKVLDAEARALGTLPQVLAFSEVYQALQTGVVDGTENPWPNMYTQKMHEVQKHASVTDHGYLGYAVIANQTFWDRLPAAIRDQLEQAIKESTDYANKIAKEENELALREIRKSGKTQIHALTPDERLSLKKVLIKVHAEMEPRIGKSLIQTVYKEVGFSPDKL